MNQGDEPLREPRDPTTTASTKRAYEHLNSILLSSKPAILEIDILPSIIPPKILYSYPALALPKSLLLNLYLHARSIFFSPPNTVELHSSNAASKIGKEKLHATAALLLWDPNHITAANYRKRYIQHISSAASNYQKHSENIGDQQDDRNLQQELLTSAIDADLNLLTSLLTSPLHKHTKSSTLWSHRLWLMRNYLTPITATYIPRLPLIDNRNDKAQTTNKLQRLWLSELEIVMKAGERHPRNYYAWEYARQLFRLLVRSYTTKRASEEERLSHQAVLKEGLGRVHPWCLMHPRDTSGWSFLVFLMERLIEAGELDDVGCNEQGVREVRDITWETRAWVRKYEWRGESLEWFLKTAEQLGIETS